MKLTKEEIEKITKEFKDDGVYRISFEMYPNGDISYSGTAESIADFWLSKIDTILEERVGKIRREIKEESLSDYTAGEDTNVYDTILDLPSLQLEDNK